LTWLWLSAFIVLGGAELNSEIEHQTRKDTTTGPARPEGQREAVKADTRPDDLGDMVQSSQKAVVSNAHRGRERNDFDKEPLSLSVALLVATLTWLISKRKSRADFGTG